MTTNQITELQPLFCSRASIVKAQDKLNDNPDMDCQLRLRFADGTEVALLISRTDIVSLLSHSLMSVENDINDTLDDIQNEQTHGDDGE